MTRNLNMIINALMTIATVSSFSAMRVAKPPVSNAITCGAFAVPSPKMRQCMTPRSIADGLTFSPLKSRTEYRTIPTLFASSSDDNDDDDDNNNSGDISSMRASEIRKELESYGISTKSFFEKSELVEALKKARAEGRTPVENKSTSSSSSSTSSSTSSSSSSSPSLSREEKIAIEVDKCKAMKVGELKKELQSLGISTRSFFEKSEFVKALAEARVDGVKNKKGAAGTAAPQQEEEEYDPSYRDVTVQKFRYDPFSSGGPLIDIRLS